MEQKIAGMTCTHDGTHLNIRIEDGNVTVRVDGVFIGKEDAKRLDRALEAYRVAKDVIEERLQAPCNCQTATPIGRFEGKELEF